eukprot:14405083-Alexandrium_andersonii.AAC.1
MVITTLPARWHIRRRHVRALRKDRNTSMPQSASIDYTTHQVMAQEQPPPGIIALGQRGEEGSRGREKRSIRPT